MVYRLRPLELTFEVDDRPYTLGDTISLSVYLKSAADLRVRGARVDLVCEESYSERSTLTIEQPIFQTTSGGIGHESKIQTGTTTVTKEINKNHRESHVHSSVTFLDDGELRAGSPPFNVELPIEATAPPHAAEAKDLVKDPSRSWSFKWTLVATVDVVCGRNPRKQKKVKVALG